ncbi:MAG: UMP kinase [Treponema sp.]|nr:UMP kinase [Treponema sp.]
MITVISLGGSIIAPDSVDVPFLRDFRSLIAEELAKDEKRQFIFVTGGGGPARTWQNAYREIAGAANVLDEEADWIGVMATRLNAQLIKALMGAWCTQPVITNPSEVGPFVGRVLVASGWKPGFSSDYDAVLLAERFSAPLVINLSNIEQVYTDDPRKNPGAKAIDTISWADFRAMIGGEWKPGINVPFDPVASRHAERLGLTVICAAGRNLANLRRLLSNEHFLGTVIS